jgi:hypothetical protein
MAACITYELPGSLLELICDEGMSAIRSFQRVALPTVKKPSATAEFPYRLGGVGMFCKEEQWRGPDGKFLCLVCDQGRPKRTENLPVPAEEGDMAACGSPDFEEAHPSQCLRVLRRLWHPPPLLSRRQGLCRLASSAALGMG